MPDYETHHWLARKVGIVVGILLGFITFMGTFHPIKSVFIGLIAYAATIAGGVVPDIDLSQPNRNLRFASIPYKQLVRLIQLLITVGTFLIYVSYSSGMSTVGQAFIGALIGGVGIVTIRSVPDLLHAVMPGHRKITHSPIFWALMSVFGIFAVRRLLKFLEVAPFVIAYLPLAIGVPILLGVITHVSLDVVNNYVRDYAPDPVKSRAAKLAPWIPKHKPVIADIPQLARIVFDGRAPWSIRFFVILTALYGLMPLDLISDAILGIGWIEDFVIYLNLRGTVYSGYQRQVGIIDSSKRRVATVGKVYIPTILLIIFVTLSYLLITL